AWQKCLMRYARGASDIWDECMEPPSLVGESGSHLYECCRRSPALYPEIKFSTLHPVRHRNRSGIADWVFPSRKLPTRLGCKLVGHCERQLRTAKCHLAASEPPDETKNPLTTAGRINNEAQGPVFVLVYSRTQFLDFFPRKRL